MDKSGPFDFAGRRGPPNETMAPEHLAVCVVYGDDGTAVFGSYVVYPSTDRRGPSKSLVLVDDRGRLASSAAFHNTIHPPPAVAGRYGDRLINANGKPSS